MNRVCETNRERLFITSPVLTRVYGWGRLTKCKRRTMFVTRFFTDDAKNGFGGHRERRGVRVPTTGFRARQKPRARFPLSALSPGFSSNSASHTNSETTIPGPVDLNHSAALDDRLKRCTVSASQQQTTRTFRAEAMYRLRGPSSDPRRGWWKWGEGVRKFDYARYNGDPPGTRVVFVLKEPSSANGDAINPYLDA